MTAIPKKEAIPKLRVNSNVKSSCEYKKGLQVKKCFFFKGNCVSEEAVGFIEQMAQEGLLRESLNLVKSQKSD